MVFIESIEIKGFKTFGNENNILNFSPNFNGIIGPTGSGKSNIFNAFKLVLGLHSPINFQSPGFVNEANPDSPATIKAIINNTIVDQPKRIILESEISKNFDQIRYTMNGQLSTDSEIREKIQICRFFDQYIIKNIIEESSIEFDYNIFDIITSLIKLNLNPVYIFNNIDTSLDIIDVRRLAELLQTLSKKSQIIMITHRDIAMRSVDNLYGVTKLRGNSKVIPVEISNNGTLRAKSLD